MVSALDSEASAPSSSSGRGHCVMFLGKIVNSHSVSIQRNKWFPVNCFGNLTNCGGATWNGLASIPSRGRRNTPSRFMLQKLR